MTGPSGHTAVGRENSTKPDLVRGIGLRSAIALNMNNMIGVGPFITLPLVVSAMGGPQALLGWIFGAILAACDGLVWAELGAAMPEAGGTYEFLRQIYGPRGLGRYLSFLYLFQLLISAPLSIATGCVGLAHYAAFLFPGLQKSVAGAGAVHLAILGSLQVDISLTWSTVVAMLTCICAAALLYRRIEKINVLTRLLWAGVILTMVVVIGTGLSHFDPAKALTFPPDAFSLNRHFFEGFGSALLIATYDYWGAYNVCFLGAEVKNPSSTIPKSILSSIGIVSILYLLLNVSVLGVIPWRQIVGAGASQSNLSVIATMMQHIYGSWAGYFVAVLVIWTAFASVFTLLLGYSRVPYAAARDGEFFASFGRLHPKHKFPYVSLLFLAGVAIVLCLFRLSQLISALVVIRIVLQFLLQQVGLIVDRVRRPRLRRPFLMWMYPFPVIAAICGFLYILLGRREIALDLALALAVITLGTAAYLFRLLKTKDAAGRNSPAAPIRP